jgi:uncharacterized membrane-anchored protein
VLPRPAGANPSDTSSAASSGTAASTPPAAPAEHYAWKVGPDAVELGHELTLALPGEMMFLGPPDAGRLLAKFGSFHAEDLLGVVAQARGADDEDAEDWFVTIRYEDEGHIGDDDAIDADELLTALKEGSEAANKERVERGFHPLHVDGWGEPPRYDRAAHHLVWDLLIHDEEGRSSNFNTRILGRRGYVSINLVTSPETLTRYKPRAATLLGATTFHAGARYQDFDSKTDEVAEYGLTGLVLGGVGLGAAKLVKIGLLAKSWNFILAALIAGKKLVVVALVGAGAYLKKLFGGRGEPPSPASGGAKP